MKARTEVQLAGFGGQGIAKAGYILGKAISLYDRREAVFTQEYGPASRGGTSSASLVISLGAIDEPFVEHPDILVALYQTAFEKYAGAIDDRALLVIDPDLVEPHDLKPTVEVRAVPCTRIADELGSKIVVNAVVLGFLAAITGDLVGADSLRQAIRESVPARTVKVNLDAFERGYDYGRERRDKGASHGDA